MSAGWISRSVVEARERAVVSYLTAGAQGFYCEQKTELAPTLRARREFMSAKRMPTRGYPECQQEGRE